MTWEQRVWSCMKAHGSFSTVGIATELRMVKESVRDTLRRLMARGAARRVQWGVYEAVGDMPVNRRFRRNRAFDAAHDKDACAMNH